MNLTTRAARRIGVAACATRPVLSAAACGSGSGGSTTSSSATPNASVDPSLKAMVPADVAADGKTVVGVDVEVFTAVAEELGPAAQFVNAPTQWATKKGNPAGVDINAPCGKKIAVQKATVGVPDIQKRSEDGKAAGKPGVTIDQYEGQDEATASVVSGKDQAMLADLPSSAYAVQQTGGSLEILSAPYDDGTYAEIMKKWGDEKGAITADQVKVNPAE